MAPTCCGLKSALRTINVCTLTGAVMLQTALMPAVLCYGGFTSRAESPAMLAAIYVLEAGILLSMTILRSKVQRRAQQDWLSEEFARVVNSTVLDFSTSD